MSSLKYKQHYFISQILLPKYIFLLFFRHDLTAAVKIVPQKVKNTTFVLKIFLGNTKYQNDMGIVCK